jgi:hypothetical protein
VSKRRSRVVAASSDAVTASQGERKVAHERNPDEYNEAIRKVWWDLIETVIVPGIVGRILAEQREHSDSAAA